MSSQEELNAEDSIVEIGTVWENFVKSDDGTSAKCTTCDKSFKTTGGNTSGLHYHLKTHKIVAKKVRKRKKADTSDVASKSLMKSRMGEGISILATEQFIKGILARLTAKRGLSFKFFEDEDIRACINALMFMLKRVERMPTSDKTIRKYVLDYFLRVKEAVIMSIKGLKKMGIKLSIVMDEWTSVANKRYMNVNLFATKKLFWSLGLIKITGSATADRLMELLLERLEDFGINYNDDIVGITTDGAATMVKLGREESAAQHQLCLIHGIHLAVVDVLYENRRVSVVDPVQENSLDSSHDESINAEETECLEGFNFVESEEEAVLQDLTLKETIGKIRQLGRFFKKSSVNNEKLQVYVKDKFNLQSTESKNLMVDSKTRWSSLYHMLERYLEIEECVDKALIDIKSDMIITRQEKYIIRCIVKTLKPVEATITSLSARDCNLHLGYLGVKWLFTELQKHNNPLTNKFAKRLYIRMKTRFNINYGVMKYLATGTFTNVIPIIPNPELAEDELYNFARYSDLSEDEDYVVVEENYNFYYSLFDIPSKKLIKAHLLKLIHVLYDTVDEPDTIVSTPEETVVSPKSFAEVLQDLFAKAEQRTDHPKSSSPSDTSQKLAAEMTHHEKVFERTGYILKMYDALKTLKPSSVESERSFSQAAQICTKFRSRLGDDTLDALSFLRSFFANPCIYEDYNS